MTKHYSPNERQSNAGNSLDEYHRQRDSPIGLNSDHFNSPNYGRGAVKRYEPRSKRPLPLLKVAVALLFFALIGFVFLFGLMDWSK